MNRKILPDHKTDGSMGFEEEDISAAKCATIFQNTESTKKLTVRTLQSTDADCTDPSCKVLNYVENVRRGKSTNQKTVRMKQPDPRNAY
jgi:hypothetical protein